MGWCVWQWIKIGCTNNNYASREKCKKCGEPKEVAAMPPGATLQINPHYFPPAQGVQDPRFNMGLLGNGALQQSLPLTSNWLLGGADKFVIQPHSTWPLGGNSSVPFQNQVGQAMVPKGWRNGDWICACGFHNYASRAQCKKCNASMPPALGTKRLASEELVEDWDNKRLNAGQTYPTHGQLPNSSYLTQMPSFVANQGTMAPIRALPGKGARQWREGDWMCTNCNNHNYASRDFCNKCNTQKEEPGLAVTVA